MLLSTKSNNSTSLSEEANTISLVTTRSLQDFGTLNSIFQPISSCQQQKIKKKRSLPGNPDPDAEVIALSPKDLLATNRFVCEICNKGFQRDQNLQLHRRGHNVPWKLRQRTSSSTDNRKRVYVCPEPSCVHHHASRALGDLTGIKKHFSRKHGEKKWKCEKCSKRYAVQSDWKAHSKICGTKEYRCDCGSIFARKDSFITHRAFCDALAEESARLSTIPQFTNSSNHHSQDLLSSLTTSNPITHQNPHMHRTFIHEPPQKHLMSSITPITNFLIPQQNLNHISSSESPVGAAPPSAWAHLSSLKSTNQLGRMVGELVNVRHMETIDDQLHTIDFLSLATSRLGSNGGVGRVNLDVNDVMQPYMQQ
ncbi:hypothetical protein Sjap_008059 [Stephania japonica]|uniref:C2H2-type domain-containing protein n=1 Tax=Stephania japonica TaxID=461633 RepID=A0AAP0JPL0_9MAGN